MLQNIVCPIHHIVGTTVTSISFKNTPGLTFLYEDPTNKSAGLFTILHDDPDIGKIEFIDDGRNTIEFERTEGRDAQDRKTVTFKVKNIRLLRSSWSKPR